jgi:predicted nucleic acid-binding protein
MIFCDTSFAAKLYALEPETAAVRTLLEEAQWIYVSELFRVEVLAVFHRRLREGKWTPAEFRAADRQFQHDDQTGFWSWLPVEHQLMVAAEQTFRTLPPDIFLRAADCIHLTTARQHGFGGIHTYDAHQSRAALALGLQALTV